MTRAEWIARPAPATTAAVDAQPPEPSGETGVLPCSVCEHAQHDGGPCLVMLQKMSRRIPCPDCGPCDATTTKEET